MIKPVVKSLAALAAILALGGTAVATELMVPLDEARPLALSESAAGVVVGNPAIAAVSVQSDRLLFVTGRSYGSTNVTVVNHAGRTILEARLTVIPDETNVVMVTKGDQTQRFDCSPLCRRRPDISDDGKSFTEVQDRITQRGGK